MAELMQLVPANKEDYPNYPSIVLLLEQGSYHVHTVLESGEEEESQECTNLIASLAYVTCVLARIPEVEYIFAE